MPGTVLGPWAAAINKMCRLVGDRNKQANKYLDKITSSRHKTLLRK